MQNVRTAEEAAERLRTVLQTLGRRLSLRDPVAQLVEALNITPPQLHTLLWLGVDEKLCMHELAARVGVTVKTMTGIVDRLEKQDLAFRSRPEWDRRVVEVRLTEKGAGMYADIDGKLFRQMIDFMSILSEGDRDCLLRIAESLLARAEAAAHVDGEDNEKLITSR